MGGTFYSYLFNFRPSCTGANQIAHLDLKVHRFPDSNLDKVLCINLTAFHTKWYYCRMEKPIFKLKLHSTSLLLLASQQ